MLISLWKIFLKERKGTPEYGGKKTPKPQKEKTNHFSRKKKPTTPKKTLLLRAIKT